MEKVQQKENKMGTMPMTKLILTMSLPAIFSMTILAMYNVVIWTVLPRSRSRIRCSCC